MYDYFEILGIPADAGPAAIRRAEGRRAHRGHPDFEPPEPTSADQDRAGPVTGRAIAPPQLDVAVDFVDIGSSVPAMQAAFFHIAH